MYRDKLMVLGLAAMVAACSDTTGTSGSGMHRVDVTLQQTDGMLLAAPIMAAAGASQGRISIDQVDSLFLTITTISFLPVLAEDDTTEASWQVIELSEPLTFDLLALPAEEDSALVIASGTLPEGDYERMRFLISASSIFLNTGVTVGNSPFAPDISHEVKVPSGSTSGLKTDLSFTVVTDTSVNLLFSALATFDKVTATGNGQIILSPVLKAKGEIE